MKDEKRTTEEEQQKRTTERKKKQGKEKEEEEKKTESAFMVPTVTAAHYSFFIHPDVNHFTKNKFRNFLDKKN